MLHQLYLFIWLQFYRPLILIKLFHFNWISFWTKGGSLWLVIIIENLIVEKTCSSFFLLDFNIFMPIMIQKPIVFQICVLFYGFMIIFRNRKVLVLIMAINILWRLWKIHIWCKKYVIGWCMIFLVIVSIFIIFV